ncbi:hypothetical protein BCR44DRAFT_352853 [Catenaria anguillulae PL171]|uniref:N-acetyltransferase domain-containing protein n=1 Tax=Catenaria anguillulae PL171 TaxID=765915 RepID=A0A1Y2I1L7_9FUNG|nr:hypothetical protein BCR44DRAFT_352853 [Catenaria anguillulae PL171]
MSMATSSNATINDQRGPRRLGLPSILVGPRLVLVSLDQPGLCAPDVIAQWTDTWFSMLTNPDVMQYLAQGGVQFMTDKSEFPQYFADRMTATLEGKAANYVVLKPRDASVLATNLSPTQDNQAKWTPVDFSLIGISGVPREILRDNDHLRRAEIGIILDTAGQGQGYTHEIMHLVLNALFNRTAEVDFQEAWWRTLDGNVGMRAWCTSVMPHIKARVWANLPETLKGTWIEYVLTRDEYNRPSGVKEVIEGKLAKVVARVTQS